MISELQDSIMALYNSDDGATLRGLLTTPNGMFDTEAWDGTKFPYMTFSIITSSVERDTCNNYDMPIVQYSIFGDSTNGQTSAPLLEIGVEFLNLFRNTLINPMGNEYYNFSSKLISERKIKDPDKGWQMIYEMEYQLEKIR